MKCIYLLRQVFTVSAVSRFLSGIFARIFPILQIKIPQQHSIFNSIFPVSDLLLPSCVHSQIPLSHLSPMFCKWRYHFHCFEIIVFKKLPPGIWKYVAFWGIFSVFHILYLLDAWNPSNSFFRSQLLMLFFSLRTQTTEY